MMPVDGFGPSITSPSVAALCQAPALTTLGLVVGLELPNDRQTTSTRLLPHGQDTELLIPFSYAKTHPNDA